MNSRENIQKAIELRKLCFSLQDISCKLNVPKSTIGGWVRHIQFSPEQKSILAKKASIHLDVARKKAKQWHQDEKVNRISLSEKEALMILNSVNISQEIISIATALLYLGEGFKSKETALGNSDPLILKFFVYTLVSILKIDRSKISCELHLRADQDETKLKIYWSTVLDIPMEQFKKSSYDMRTLGTPSYATYNGVCVVRAGNIAIQRKLLYLGRTFCERVSGSAFSSVGRASS
ncbi:MAG: hypothetical protein WCV79_02570 [Candidatus Paceibacterota bacterium]